MKIIRILLTFLTFTLSAFVYAGPVDINIADAPTLAKNIKGVGLKKAKVIVAYREKHGMFNKVEDITKVKGIGPKLLEKNRNVLIVKSKKVVLKTSK